MKRKISMLIAILLCLSVFAGCNKPNSDTGLPPFEPPTSEGISSVAVSSLPEGYNYSFKGTPAKEVVNYFANLNLITDFTEDPKQYTGMTWQVSITYDDGTHETIYHFGNMFVRREGGSWYKMNYDEATQFDSLLKDLNDRIGFEVQVNWADFVKINGITYFGDWRTTEVSAKEIGEKIGEVSCGVPQVYNVSDFEPEEGSAYICAVETELFSILGSNDSIAALVDGKYYLYKADEEPPFQNQNDIDKEIPSLAEIDQYTQEELDKKLVGVSRDHLLSVWGKPDGILSGLWGEIWKLGNEKGQSIIIYYINDGQVDEIKVKILSSVYDFGFSYSISDENVNRGERIGITVKLTNQTGKTYAYAGSTSHFRAQVKLYVTTENGEYSIPYEPIPDTDDVGEHEIINGESRSFTFYFNIPSDAPVGKYDLECRFQNSESTFWEVFTLD